MKRALSAFLFATTSALGLAVPPATAQAQAEAPAVVEDFQPSWLNQPDHEYPQVNSQGYARFRVIAPKAQSVMANLGLGGQGGTVLIKKVDGSRMGTSAGPLNEGFHYFHLEVDSGNFAPLLFRDWRVCERLACSVAAHALK